MKTKLPDPKSKEVTLEWLKSYEDEVLGRAAGEKALPCVPPLQDEGKGHSEFEG